MSSQYYLTAFTEESANRLKNRIGKFMERRIPWIDNEGQLVRVQTLNDLDRVALAREFYQLRFHGAEVSTLLSEGFELNEGKTLTNEDLILETAKHIDLKLPVLYWSRKCRESRNAYPGIGGLKGMTFCYRANNIVDLQVTNQLRARANLPASFKQVKTIQSILESVGLELIPGSRFSVGRADQIISGLNAGRIPKDFLTECVRKNEIYYSTEVRHDLMRA